MRVKRMITGGLLGALVLVAAGISQAQTTTQLTTSAKTTFSVGLGPEGVATDGASVFVANQFSNTITKLRASDGTTAGTYTVGHRPVALVFDGGFLWVAN